jgi:outer membrane protein assembly factor BamD
MIAEIGIQCTANSVTFWVWIKKMRTAKYYIYSGLIVLFLLMTACATSTDPADAYKGESPEQIFQKGEDALRDKNWPEAIKRFEALDAQYPYGRNEETAQLHIIYAYYMNADYAAAESAADRFIHTHPTSPHDDYAYYMRGLSNYYQNMGVFEKLFKVDFATRDLTQVKKSFNDFNDLQTHYPNSSFAPAAHQYTIYLRDVLANHQIETANYYFRREAYVASANRASLVVENYQGSAATPDALVMMAKSYYQLGLTDQMNQAIQVLNYNYPDSKYTQEVSGRELARKKFSIVKHKDVVEAPQRKVALRPPTENQQAYYTNYQTNGARGTVQPVSHLVQEIRSSNIFASHPKQVTAPVDTQQQVTQRTSVQQQAPAAVAAPTQQTASNTKAPGGTSLNTLLEKLSSSKLFAIHKKPAEVQSNPQVAQNSVPANPAPQTVTAPARAIQENGTRR